MIYSIWPYADETIASLVFTRDLEAGENYLFRGEKQTNWEPITFAWSSTFKKLPQDELTKHDFTMIVGAGFNTVLNERAKAVLEPLLKDDAQYLPVNIDGETDRYYLLNITNVIEGALVPEQSEYRIRKNGEVGLLKTAVYDESKFPENRIFTTPESSNSAFVIGNWFIDVCKEHGLKGLEFQEEKAATTISS
ncbi:imm11 family protein [Aliikangiella sp. IMCC44359]|uniref:imm11 family protein n=1 Tax=Aliikangiella sp. IMCC44359 TaxID=3459125 RepID=UPI00403B037F